MIHARLSVSLARASRRRRPRSGALLPWLGLAASAALACGGGAPTAATPTSPAPGAHTPAPAVAATGNARPTGEAAATAGAPSSAAPGSAAAPPASSLPDPERGGRLYDSWRTELKLSRTLEFDSPMTPELDGKGGPNGNGTLNDGRGRPMPNTGHDYRLRSFFGWDLRGKLGMSGPRYHGESHVLERDLLEDTRSAAEIRSWLEKGDEQLPAYGQVLTARDLDDLTAFLVQSREGLIARPEQVFELDASVPGKYRLRAGADAARGAELFYLNCSDCHGNDGRKLPFDAGHTLGTYARSRGYEAWFKIQNGLAGSPMKGQIAAETGAEAAQTLLDLLAALCDRKQFPGRDFVGVSDVPDGDPRCGKYLK